jgi:hypothetical protein
MQRIIEVREATIKTATVEIKTLRIGAKQMTLSVFRQLPEKHIIDREDRDFFLRGEPWGLVNYFKEGCSYRIHGKTREHLHVVWCEDGRLYRACVGRVHLKKDRKRDRICGDPWALDFIACDTCNYYEALNNGYPGWECAALPNAGDGKFEVDVRQWNDLYGQLAALDQLFIAV